MKYFRIENYDNEIGESLSGFVGVISAMLLLSLGLTADAGDDEYNAALSVAKDKNPDHAPVIEIIKRIALKRYAFSFRG